MLKRIISSMLMVVILFSSVMVFSDSITNEVVVSIGKNLNEEQRREVLNYFNVDENTRIVEVTNQEEREYLGKHIDEKLLGTRALSCAYVEKIDEGEGITVETNNISWVTEDMYRNALITAGVKDANVKVTSPIKVSGTAALTGIIKAFEGITGEAVTEEEKEVASEEIAKTAMLGDEIGKEKATELVNNVKTYIVANNIKDEKGIRDAIEDMSKELRIELTDKQIEEILSLMKRISELDLNLDDIKTQLKDISGKLDNIIGQNEEVKSFLVRILDAIVDFFKNLFN